MIEFAGIAYTLARDVYGYIKDGKTLLDAAKDAYTVGKDIKEHFEVKELEPKLVDYEWVGKSELLDADKNEPSKVRLVQDAGVQLNDRVDRVARRQQHRAIPKFVRSRQTSSNLLATRTHPNSLK